MTRLATLTLAVSLFAPAALAATIDGAWTASHDDRRADRLYLSISLGRSFQNGNTMRTRELTGLSDAQIRATTMTPVRFELRREAGTIAFEGTFRNGKGAGQFDFTPNRGYIGAVRALGIEFDLGRRRHRDRSDDEDLFHLAMHDVSTAFIKSMIAEGYRVSLDDYLSMRIFDITPEYIREMRSLGFASLDAGELVASRIHKVTPGYVREMRAAGWKDLSLDELQSTRIHGATPEFAEEMKKLGYGGLDLDDLVSFRIHRVTAEFITELRTLGYRDVPADDLLAMRIHRVTPDFIRKVANAGYVNVPVEKLIEMRIHRIDPEMLRKLK